MWEKWSQHSKSLISMKMLNGDELDQKNQNMPKKDQTILRYRIHI